MAAGSAKEMSGKRKHNLLICPPGVAVSPVGLRVATRLSYDQWSDLVGGLQRVHRSILWILGDALCWGQDNFGEEFSQALSEYSKQTQSNAMWVSRKIEFSRRLETLSWSHHQEIAYLDNKAEQDRFLKEAVKNRWTVQELRQQIRLFREPPPKLDWHETSDPPPVVPEDDPEFDAMSDVRPSRFYPEIPETIGPLARPINLEVQYNRIVGIVRAFRAAEKQDNDGEANRQRTAMDFFLAEVDRREERGE
jgi:hypothetical protein